jgi:hypothetical protein
MEIKFPARDRINQNTEILINGLEQNLKTITDIKTDLLKMQKFEQSSQFRDVEKLIEITLAEMNKVVKSTTHNNA